MKFHLVLFFVLIFGFSAFGQQTQIAKCRLSLYESPAFRGLRLGMAVEEAKKALGMEVKVAPQKTYTHYVKEGEEYIKVSTLEKEKYEKSQRDFDIGETSFSLEDVSKIPGLSRLQLSFFESKLYNIALVYSSTDVKWDSVKEFIFINSEKMNLPFSAWELSDRGAFVSCLDFNISTTELGGDIFLNATNTKATKRIDELALEQLKKSDKEAEIKDLEKKKAFKP